MGRPADLAILGSYPPPYGGVGSHVERLCPLLRERGVSFVVYNGSSDVGNGDDVVAVYRHRHRWLLTYALFGREPVVYVMSARLSTWFIAAMMACLRRKRVLLRLRNTALPDCIAAGGWRRRLARFIVRRMHAVICVSELLADQVASLGLDQSRIHWVPGFLPPVINDESRSAVDADVWPFIAAHDPVITINGKVSRYDGNDLYGLDHAVELAGRLRNDFPRLGIVAALGECSPEDAGYIDQLQTRAEALGVGDQILFNTSPGPFAPILAAGDVFVRPTNTDGDAISVREALFLGIPTVASDVVVRPAKARLFRTRDLDDFEAQTRHALAHLGDGRPRQPEKRLNDDDQTRIDHYLDLLASIAGQ